MSDWINHKVCTLKDHNNTGNEVEEHRTVTYWSDPSTREERMKFEVLNVRNLDIYKETLGQS